MAIGALALLAVLLAGCAGGAATDPKDPFEPMNRVFFRFNDTLDKTIAKPVSEAYVKYTPAPMRTAIYNFFDNAAYPGVAINNILQGKFERGLDDAGRFLFNSTFGLGGLIDFAGPLGFQRHEEDFGQTLGVWGFGPGPYLDLPLFGPSSGRDIFRIPVETFTTGLYFVNSDITFPLSFLEKVDQRARLSTAIDIRDKNALDPYAFQREGYLQHRRSLIYDGNPPLENLDLPAPPK